MVVIIAANYPVAKNITEKLYKEHNLKFCAIETEYQDGSLNENNIGVEEAFNHHTIDKGFKQPCLAFQSNKHNFENFCISHIDADTIFGIGWLSGMFVNINPGVYQKLVKISELISIGDNFGFHSIPKESLKPIQKEWDVIWSYVSHAKKMVNKSNFKKYYNCTSIISKTLKNILLALQNDEILNKKYNLLEYVGNAKLLDGSTDTIHIYNKKINDFNSGNHKFILIYDYSISFFAKDIMCTKEYFPEGLHEFMNKHIPGSGGHFTAAGSPRSIKMDSKKYNLLKDKILERIVYIDSLVSKENK